VQSNNDCGPANGKRIVFGYGCVPGANPAGDYSVICKNMTRGGGDRGVDCRPDLDKQAAKDSRDVVIVGGVFGGIALGLWCFFKWGKCVDAKEARRKSGDPGVQMAAQPAQPSTAPPQAAPQQMQMQIPLNWAPGQPLITAVPGGGQMHVIPPVGSLAGQMIMV
jgi:hypothetical protein